MPSNLAINDKLLNEALIISGLKTKKYAINCALKEFINRRKQLEILDLFGQCEPDSNYSYKNMRS